MASAFGVTCVLCAHLMFSDAFQISIGPVGRQKISSSLRAVTSDIQTEADVPFGIDSWRDGYKTCKKEIVEALEAGIPADLEGTYFRNGFGKFESGRVPILHPFDADGMMAAVTMKVVQILGSAILMMPSQALMES